MAGRFAAIGALFLLARDFVIAAEQVHVERDRFLRWHVLLFRGHARDQCIEARAGLLYFDVHLAVAFHGRGKIAPQRLVGRTVLEETCVGQPVGHDSYRWKSTARYAVDTSRK